MMITVSVSELRNNISSYLEKVTKGTRILVRDEKKNITIAKIVQVNTFDKELYSQALQKAAGILSETKYPQWKTKKDITKWISSSRLSDERKLP